MSGFAERVIEDWLTNADERSYQLSFAAYLARSGHTIRYFSSHSTLEHGKDLITTKSRKIYAYQLKAGNVDKSMWRSIRGEVLEAAMVPVDIPGLPKRVADEACLVLTGRLTDSVRNEISLTNIDLRSKGYARVTTLELPALVAGFTSVFQEFLPSSLKIVNDLVRSFLRNGAEPCDKEFIAATFSSLLESYPKKRPVGRTTSDLIVAAEFSSASMQRSQNYVGLIDHWVIAASQLLRFAAQRKILGAATDEFMDRCNEVIGAAADSLALEVEESKDFRIESALLDEAFVSYRRTFVLGYLAARVNSRFIQGGDVRSDSAALLEIAKREIPYGFWGEGAWNYWLNLAIAVSHSPEGMLFGEGLVANWVDHVCPRSEPFPRDPYSQAVDQLSLLKTLLELIGTERRDDRMSYSAESAIAFLVRRLRRQAVAQRWAQFSRFQLAHVKPDKASDELLWQVEDGKVIVEVLPETGSWAELQQRALRHRSKLFRKRHLWILPYFLCTFPHRISPGLSGELYVQASSA